MVDYYQPQNIISIGNNNSIQTQYLAAASHLIEINSINESDSVKSIINNIKKVDFIFLNNNELNNTLNQFEILLSAFHNKSFFILNNIHSNKEAKANWQSIQNNSSVKATIDLFHLGIVLFNQDFKVKQHFKVRF
jgi:ABC-type Fe2+-enterobactin transport system substrate-binding protein